MRSRQGFDRQVARYANANVLKKMPEFVIDSAFAGIEHVAQRRVEAQAGLDRHRQAIEKVGQLELDLLRRSFALPAMCMSGTKNAATAPTTISSTCEGGLPGMPG